MSRYTVLRNFGALSRKCDRCGKDTGYFSCYWHWKDTQINQEFHICTKCAKNRWDAEAIQDSIINDLVLLNVYKTRPTKPNRVVEKLSGAGKKVQKIINARTPEPKLPDPLPAHWPDPEDDGSTRYMETSSDED